MTITYRLHSSPAIHTPGIVAWAINGYAFPDDRPALLNVLTSCFPAVPADALHNVLMGATPHRIVDDVVEFDAVTSSTWRRIRRLYERVVGYDPEGCWSPETCLDGLRWMRTALTICPDDPTAYAGPVLTKRQLRAA